MDKIKARPDGKLVLVIINPTPAAEGKTTITVGLVRHWADECKLVIDREPSLGPCFGVKGGAAGGGYARWFYGGFKFAFHR